MTHRTTLRIDSKEFEIFKNNDNSPSLSKFVNVKIKEYNKAQTLVSAKIAVNNK